MAKPKQLDFSDDNSPSTRKSPRKRASNPSPASETTKKKKKKKKTKKSAPPVSNRIWNEEDELTVLKGLVDYLDKEGVQPNSDWDAFYHFLGDSIAEKFSKQQLLSKIRKLKKKFLLHMEKTSQGDDMLCDSEAIRLSRMIWGQNGSESANNQSKSFNQDEALKDNDQVANAEANENVAALGDKNTDVDESGTLRDAFESIMSRWLSDHQKKVQLENLMNLEAGKRKELSDEWKELCAEEARLNIKKFKYSAKFAEAAAKR
ncbi:hypothetical protein EUTSA_v10027890mg [Eutrema salsugineum]|uniref:Glabrous enhancer-binding protein-like DBD domain-containing protein n=1 Tax=Eutrema salsugineum TaxID=72664 RepID=V4LAC3_EUTSA|nr:GLABROUS1 enhancer-binding protein [Eutrema salsugineum]XP_006405927.1 GLABROUS1 enhancer-binding protein [Eutrema salsugineum]ESQ47379.1 hypothetical protein EUTSA_v10027890mg [Eutrema salsugineum]ESQ47380.1 hypothetical protein EUTSA_v10027890mg [Eutrema salsugineum]